MHVIHVYCAICDMQSSGSRSWGCADSSRQCSRRPGADQCGGPVVNTHYHGGEEVKVVEFITDLYDSDFCLTANQDNDGNHRLHDTCITIDG